MVSPVQASRLQGLVDDLLDRGYDTTANTVLKALTSDLTSGVIRQRLQELEDETFNLVLAGKRLESDNPVLRALMADLEPVLRRAAARVDTAGYDLQRQGAQSAATIQEQLALPGMGPTARVSVGWNVPDPEAVNELVGIVGSFEWDEALGDFQRQAIDKVNELAIRGIVQGWNPRKTARLITQSVQGFSPHLAQNLMRTTQLTSYRRATAIHQRANSHIIVEQIRVAALDARTCAACIALHGTRYPAGEVIPDHHQGRCTSIPVVKGRERTVVTGPEWFNSLSPDEQAQLAPFQRSPGKLELLRRGDVTWGDFVMPYRDPVFGDMVRERSIIDMFGGKPPPTGGGRTQGVSVSRRPTGGRILTGDGWRNDDSPSFADIRTPEQLGEYLAMPGGLRKFDMFNTGAVSFDASGNAVIDRGALREHIKTRFVRDSRSVDWSRDYMREYTQSFLSGEGINVTLQGAEDIINADEARRADALMKLAEVSGLRLTEPQRRRLNQARSGGYTDMIFAEVGDRGTVLNEMDRAKENWSGLRRGSAEHLSKKDDFDRIMGRGEYLEQDTRDFLARVERDNRRRGR